LLYAKTLKINFLAKLIFYTIFFEVYDILLLVLMPFIPIIYQIITNNIPYFIGNYPIIINMSNDI